ncbi:GrpB protein [compost metagenome]
MNRYWRDANQITTFEAGDPDENPWVMGQPKSDPIEVQAYDPTWAELFQALRADIATALAGKTLAIEYVRHVLFRDWLRTHPQDRTLYAEAKIQAKDGADTFQAYNMRKQTVVREIYTRIFESHGLLKTRSPG